MCSLRNRSQITNCCAYAATDIYVITTYYQSEELRAQANALLAMITVNMIIQLTTVLAQYKKKSMAVKLYEVIICPFFLHPAVDAYRVSTNHEDEEEMLDSLTEILVNKCTELATESITGCILQLYVWLINPDNAGVFALLSIGVSALTTGHTCAMIAFDVDIDVTKRKNQPLFYGDVPDVNGE